jgi:hypothetical protein
MTGRGVERRILAAVNRSLSALRERVCCLYPRTEDTNGIALAGTVSARVQVS